MFIPKYKHCFLEFHDSFYCHVLSCSSPTLEIYSKFFLQIAPLKVFHIVLSPERGLGIQFIVNIFKQFIAFAGHRDMCEQVLLQIHILLPSTT